MSILNRCSISRSQHSYRQVQEPSLRLWAQGNPADPPTIEYQEIPCVNVTVPQEDWEQIQQIVQSHERYNCHPAVQDAWERYQMCLNLVA